MPECKVWHWKNSQGIEYDSVVCTPSKPKTIHFGDSFRPCVFDWVRSDGSHEVRLRLWKFELIMFRRWYNFNTDEFLTFWRMHWNGKRLFGPADVEVTNGGS